VETYKVQHSTVQPPENDQEFFRLKEQVLICERELLRVLGFDLQVEHAYRPLLAYVKSISGPRDLAQIAWNFINDSLRTTICLQYAPRCVAAAAAQMASEYLESKQRPFPLPPHPRDPPGPWYNAFQVQESTVRTIVEAIKQMYDDNRGAGAGVPVQSSGTASSRPSAPSSAAADSRPAASGGGRDASAGRVKSEGSHRPSESSQPSSAGGRRDDGVKREESSSRRDAPRGIAREGMGSKREMDGGAADSVKEEGELDEAPSALPPSKRSKEAEG